MAVLHLINEKILVEDSYEFIEMLIEQCNKFIELKRVTTYSIEPAEKVLVNVSHIVYIEDTEITQIVSC